MVLSAVFAAVKLPVKAVLTARKIVCKSLQTHGVHALSRLKHGFDSRRERQQNSHLLD
jgi:hypothetical protein